MATSGRKLAAAVALCIPAVTLAGCSPEHRRQSETPATAPTANASAPTGNFCQVNLPGSWQAVFAAGRVPHEDGEALTVHAAAAHGTSVFADSYRKGQRAVVWLRKERPRVTVLEMVAPDNDQMSSADFDGRWLVFGIYHDRRNLNDWTLYGWDSTSQAPPRVLARNRIVQGAPALGPILHPRVYAGMAVWSQGVGDNRSELHLYNLASGEDRIVRAGRPDSPTLWGSTVLWHESADPDQPSRMHAVSALTGKAAVLPAVLRDMISPVFLTANSDTLAWTDPNMNTLSAWRPGWTAPVQLQATTDPTQHLQWPQISGDIVTWENGDAFFATDLRSHSYTQITPKYGSALIWHDTLVVSYEAKEKHPHAVVESTAVHSTDLPQLPTCR